MSNDVADLPKIRGYQMVEEHETNFIMSVYTDEDGGVWVVPETDDGNLCITVHKPEFVETIEEAGR